MKVDGRVWQKIQAMTVHYNANDFQSFAKNVRCLLIAQFYLFQPSTLNNTLKFF